MVLGLLGLLGAIFSVTSGVVDIANYAHDHPWGRLAPGDPRYEAACRSAFKSYDPDTHTWFDGKAWRPCVIRVVKKSPRV